ncbi:MAG: CDP-alcohol phosphatidyltransferase family protein, partial [Nitrospinota bacterium]
MSTLFSEFKKMGKPRDVEEVWDMIRPAGFLLVQLLRKTKITPNQVSALSVFAAFACAFLLYKTFLAENDLVLSFFAALMMFFYSALDSADGQLARATGQGTFIGRTVDGFCDNMSFLLIYLAILIGYFEYTGAFSWEILVLAVLAGVSHSFQSAAADFQRSLYLFHVYDSLNMEKETEEAFNRILKSDLSPLHRFLILAHKRYSRNQSLLLRSSARLHSHLLSLRNSGLDTREEISKVYSELQRGILKGWALLASNSHKFGIIGGAFLPVSQGSFFEEFGLCWYFVYELIF